jgi:hypothetical protein
MPQAFLALFCALGVAFSSAGAWAQDKAAAPKVSPAEAKYDNPQQAALIKQQIATLAPQQKGVTDVYAIGVAGWATQDVFVKELEGALASIGKVLPLNGGTVRLINSPATVEKIPLASRHNIAAAVRGVGKVLDKDEDVLLLFMTSHGGKRGFGVQLPAIAVQMTPGEVAAILKKEGIRNRVIIVSACYSGLFVKPLADDNTIILTSADEKSSSFGCKAGRDWTYFGDALFNHSLKPGKDFSGAFAGAKILIQGWEMLDGFAPSNPQGHFGAALVRKLRPLFDAQAELEQ